MTAIPRPLKQESSPEVINIRIDHASAEMFVRELLMNGIEAAMQTSSPQVDFWYEDYDGTPKLSVWNNGQGMNDEELLQNMNLGKSGGQKKQGVYDNYGVGAKVTVLKACREGAIYQSCKDGIVSQIHLGRDEDGVAGIQPVEGLLVNDMSEFYSEEMRANDWTKVVLLGNSPTHNTVTHPLSEGKKFGTGESYWLPALINQRFFDLSHVKVRAICNPVKWQRRVCRGMKNIPNDAETLVECDGFSIRYTLIKDGHKSNYDANGWGGHGCIVYKNEIYNLCHGPLWTKFSSRMGIYHVGPRIGVEIILGQSFPVSPDLYRMCVQREMCDGEREPVDLWDFSKDVFDNRPDWLIEFCEQNQPKKFDVSQSAKRRMKEIENSINAMLSKHDPEIEDGEGVGGESETQQKNEKPKERSEHREPNKTRIPGSGRRPGTSDKKVRVRFPQAFWLNDYTDLKRRGILRRLCDYDQEQNAIYFNETYPTVKALVDFSMGSKCLDETFRQCVVETVKEEIHINTGTQVLYTESLIVDDSWSREEIDDVLTSESLTASFGCAEVHKPNLNRRIGQIQSP